MIRNLLLALMLLAVCAGGGFWYWTTTPQYAMQQVSKAIREHDVDTFNNWVDVQSVASAAVDDTLAEPVRAVGGGGLLERVVGLGVMSVLRPTVVDRVAKQIDSAVAKTGLDADAAPPPEQPHGLLGELVQMVKPPSLTETLRDYGFTKQNYRGVGDVRSEGNNADVGLRFFIPRKQGEVQLHLALNNASGHWRVVRIANLQEIVRGIIGT
jgi:hypothetical protein